MGDSAAAKRHSRSSRCVNRSETLVIVYCFCRAHEPELGNVVGRKAETMDGTLKIGS